MSDDDEEDYGDDDYQEPSTSSSRPYADASSACAAQSQPSAGSSQEPRDARAMIENALRDVAQMTFSQDQQQDLEQIGGQLRYFASRFGPSFNQEQLRQVGRFMVEVQAPFSLGLCGIRNRMSSFF